MKITIKVIIISAVLILSISFISFKISGLDSDNSNSSLGNIHSWTKAICNETSCQDYEIYCNDKEMISETPITGAVMYIPKGWEDPRNETMRDRICD